MNKLAGALALTGALTASADAQEAESVALPVASEVSAQVTDCVGFVREQRDLARDTGITMSRSAQKGLLLDCQNGELEARIAQQNQILAALNTEIAEIGLRINDQAQIVDDQGRELAQIITINGQLVIRIAETDTQIAETEAEIAALRADTAAKLAKAEAILQRLATS